MKVKLFFSIFLFIFIAGCVPSLHELWTKETLVYDDAISGKYQQDDNVWEFVGRPDDKSYKLTIHEKEGKQSKLVAHLVEIDSQRFLDLYPADDAELEGGDWLKFHLVPAHLFLHVTQTKPKLVLAAMNPDEVGKLLKEKPEMIKHEVIEDDRVVLTDSPENLQKFLLAGLKIEKFFGDPVEMKPLKAE
jgi:hypothetical protein